MTRDLKQVNAEKFLINLIDVFIETMKEARRLNLSLSEAIKLFELTISIIFNLNEKESENLLNMFFTTLLKETQKMPKRKKGG